jgi:hypothetical protein
LGCPCAAGPHTTSRVAWASAQRFSDQGIRDRSVAATQQSERGGSTRTAGLPHAVFRQAPLPRVSRWTASITIASRSAASFASSVPQGTADRTRTKTISAITSSAPCFSVCGIGVRDVSSHRPQRRDGHAADTAGGAHRQVYPGLLPGYTKMYSRPAMPAE